MTAPEADRVPITDWDHNRWYHRLLLGQVPAGAQRVLDVGSAPAPWPARSPPGSGTSTRSTARR